MFDLAHLTDYGLLFMRIMAGAIYADSGYNDLKDLDARAKSQGLSKPFAAFIAVAELAGAAGIIFGVFQQLAAIGLILIMLGAIQKKIFAWKTGFWGASSPGWYYELTIISMLLVVIATDGGRFVIWG